MVKLSKEERERYVPCNNYITIKADSHFDWIRDSNGKPFLQRLTKFDAYKNSITSGTVTAVCNDLTIEYKYGTEVEVQVGDKVIFNYMAIKKTPDGINLAHDKTINVDGELEYPIKYDDCYVRIRNEAVTPINGWVILEMEDVEINSKIFIPEYLKKKKSSSIGAIKYIGTPLKYYREWENEGVDSNAWHEGQKVVIPTYKAIPLQRPEHCIIGQKTLIRVQRKDMTDYNWLQNSVLEWTSRPDYVKPQIKEVRLTPDELKPYLIGGTPQNPASSFGISHGLKHRNTIEKQKIVAHEIAIKEHLDKD